MLLILSSAQLTGEMHDGPSRGSFSFTKNGAIYFFFWRGFVVSVAYRPDTGGWSGRGRKTVRAAHVSYLLMQQSPKVTVGWMCSP